MHPLPLVLSLGVLGRAGIWLWSWQAPGWSRVVMGRGFGVPCRKVCTTQESKPLVLLRSPCAI